MTDALTSEMGATLVKWFIVRGHRKNSVLPRRIQGPQNWVPATVWHRTLELCSHVINNANSPVLPSAAQNIIHLWDLLSLVISHCSDGYQEKLSVPGGATGRRHWQWIHIHCSQLANRAPAEDQPHHGTTAQPPRQLVLLPRQAAATTHRHFPLQQGWYTSQSPMMLCFLHLECG
jgi:hypothetical protein